MTQAQFDFAAFIEQKYRPEPPDETVGFTINKVKSELQLINLRLEQLYEERVKLESYRSKLQSRLLEVADRSIEQERARELALRVRAVEKPRSTRRCSYCAKHTRKLFGDVPVCDECRVQVEYITDLNSIDDFGIPDEELLEEGPKDVNSR
jgi:hypothetical protein